jgi:hypothetical protein
VSVNGGRNDGAGNSIYDFIYDFDPTVGNGSINNLTIKILATTFNNDSNTLFYFQPFKFQSFNVASTKSQNFTFSVNKDQLSKIKDNLDHFEVWYKPNITTGKWATYVSNISKDKIDQNGLVSYNKLNGTRFIGGYVFKIVAVDNWSNRQDSNLLYTAGSGPVTKTIYTSFAKSFVTIPPATATASPKSLAKPDQALPDNISTQTIPIINSSNDTGFSEDQILKIIFIASSILAILFLIILLKRRKKNEKDIN